MPVDACGLLRWKGGGGGGERERNEDETEGITHVTHVETPLPPMITASYCVRSNNNIFLPLDRC